MLVRHLTDGQDVDPSCWCASCATPASACWPALGDRSGTVIGVLHGGAAARLCERGAVVHVVGVFEVHPRHGAQIAVARSSRRAREVD